MAGSTGAGDLNGFDIAVAVSLRCCRGCRPKRELLSTMSNWRFATGNLSVESVRSLGIEGAGPVQSTDTTTTKVLSVVVAIADCTWLC